DGMTNDCKWNQVMCTCDELRGRTVQEMGRLLNVPPGAPPARVQIMGDFLNSRKLSHYVSPREEGGVRARCEPAGAATRHKENQAASSLIWGAMSPTMSVEAELPFPPVMKNYRPSPPGPIRMHRFSLSIWLALLPVVWSGAAPAAEPKAGAKLNYQ